MNKKVDELVTEEKVETEKVVEKKTTKSAATTTVTPKKIEEYKPEKKVLVKSIAGWTTGFQRIESNGDVTIPPMGSVRLQASEIITQVQNGNLLFNGTDGQGAHATLFINDKATRIEANYEDENTCQKFVTNELIKKIFDEKNQKDFEEKIKDSVITRAEKSFLMESIKSLKFNDYQKIAFCENYTGIRL